MRFTNPAVGTIFALSVAAMAACSSPSEPHTFVLEGSWEGTSTTGVEYVYVFSGAETNETNPRTGNDARLYSLEATTTPGTTITVSAWYEAPMAYWGLTSLGTITDNRTMTVEAQDVEPFIMHRQ